MVKCNIKGCGKLMNKMHLIDARTDGNLYENLETKRTYHICTECEVKLGLKEEKKKA